MRTWLLALLIVGVVLGSLELGFRRMGLRPTVTDSKALWSFQRSCVYSDGDMTPLVLLGASRIQVGFDMKQVRQRYPHHRVVQLAVDGTHPWATLRDLALDERFRGIVICSITAAGFCRSARDEQSDYVMHYRSQYNLNAAGNVRVSSFLQSRLVILNPSLKAETLLRQLVKGRPVTDYLRTFPDRGRLAEYARVPVDEFRANRIERSKADYARTVPLPPETWLTEALEIEACVRRIQDRGGKVVLVRLPTTDEFWACDQTYWPKARYWDVFARHTAATAIHFKDYSELACFDCPDTSHLDARDAPAFTRSLLRILEARHIISAIPSGSSGTRASSDMDH